MSSSWFVVAFNLVYRLTTYSEVFIRQFLDCNGEKLLRDMGYLGGCRCQPLYKLFLLFSGQSVAFY